MKRKHTQAMVAVWAPHTNRAGDIAGFVADNRKRFSSDDYVHYNRSWATYTLKCKDLITPSVQAERAIARAIIAYTN